MDAGGRTTQANFDIEDVETHIVDRIGGWPDSNIVFIVDASIPSPTRTSG